MAMKTIKLFELKKIQTQLPAVKITTPEEAAAFIRQFYFDDIEIFESFFILLLNQANKTIGYSKISQGGISGTVVDIRIIAKYAIESLATSVILAHNHPSGNLNPSSADIKITEKIESGLKILDIKVYDHIILSADSFYSFKTNNDL
jgi:DNA repair protein RadC